jgi:hypothetical protein
MSRYVYRMDADVPPRAVASGGGNVIRLAGLGMIPGPGIMRQACPAYGCNGPAPVHFMPYDPIITLPNYAGAPVSAAGNGATAQVPQPPPSSGGLLTVPNVVPLPVSPQPAPTVAAPTELSLTQPGTTLDASGASTTVASTGLTAWMTDIENWFGASTTIGGTSIPNIGIAAALGLAAMMFMGNRGGRRR